MSPKDRHGHELSTLSYAWGDSTPSHSIICDGSLIHITASLHAALLAIRRQFSNASPETAETIRMPVWADAMCINQGDIQERSTQVALVGRIYESSQRLTVWLGESSIDEEVSGVLKTQDNPSEHGSDPKGRRFESMRDIYHREWFRRRWVIQELMLSANVDVDVLIGKHALSLIDLVRNGAQITPPRILGEYSRLRRAKEWFKTEEDPKRTLLENLTRYERQHCSDPRDRVYALLSISSDGGDFQVDYAQSHHTLYIELAKRYAGQGKAGELLLRASCKPTKSRGSMPSWVPDWSTKAGHFSRRHWEATCSVEACNVADGLWGGRGVPDNIVLSGDKLRIEGRMLGPCRQHDDDGISRMICPQCITTPVLQSYLAREVWADNKRVQVIIPPPRAEEINSGHEKTAFLLYPAKASTGLAEEQENEVGEEYELVSCLKIALDFDYIAKHLGVLDQAGEGLDRLFRKSFHLV